MRVVEEPVLLEMSAHNRRRPGSRRSCCSSTPTVCRVRCAIELGRAARGSRPECGPGTGGRIHLHLAATLAREEQLAVASAQVSAERVVWIEATDARLVAIGWSDQRWAHPERNDTNLDEHR